MKPKHRHGFSLLETIITIAVIGLAAQVVYSWVLLVQQHARDAQARTVASTVATEYLELIRNAPYDDVGTTTGLPVGTFPATQTVQRGDIGFTVNIAIDFVDDPFDGNALGTIPNKPVDTVPADYKRAEVEVCWTPACNNPVQFTTTVAPLGLETASNTGALFIQVTDADGLPVPLVDVQVINSTVAPAINIVNTTDIQGRLQLLSLPPATGTYHIEVSKNGYSADQTLPPTGGNPNPVNPDTTVVVGGVTQVSFSIDRVSTLSVHTTDGLTCGSVGAVQLRVSGDKLIGTGPDVKKFSQTYTTNANGDLTINNLEWDVYDVEVLTSSQDLSGADPPLKLTIAPNTNPTLNLRLNPDQTTTLLVMVAEAGTNLPLSDADVHVTGPGFDETKTTNQGFLTQTDWSGGAGQATFGDADRYESSSGAIDTSQPGEIRLASHTANDSASEDFSTLTLRDTGMTTATWDTASSVLQLPPDALTPGQYESSAAAQSLTLNSQTGKITSVTLNATETLNGETIDYFVAADGASFEPVTPGNAHTMLATGSDLRWRAVLSTANPLVTPVVTQLTLTYTLEILDGTDGTLTSSSFDTTVASTFTSLVWNPTTQPVSAGPNALRVQIATNSDNSTWSFHGPDGTSGTYYTVSGATIAASESPQRYLRYRAFVHTDDPLANPTFSDVAIVHSNSCFPPGQVFFSPLPGADDYTVEVSKAGYDTVTTTVTVAGDTRHTILLTPN